MEELIELRESIKMGNYAKALQIVDKLEEMSVEDKLNKIFSYMIILLLHLIKENAEKRLTKSWKHSINNSVNQINRTNKRRKTGGYYATKEDLQLVNYFVFIYTLDRLFGGGVNGYSPTSRTLAFSSSALLSRV